MKSLIFIILLIAVTLSGCKKDETISNSGIDTINNTLYGTTTYYAKGFLFSQAKIVSTLNTPKPDITIDNDGTLLNLIIQTNNFMDSFYKVGEFASASEAEQAFNNLTSPSIPQWVVWANPVKPNQVWLFRTSSEHYAKIRIISIISETRDSRNYAECTFQWVYQPDGTLSFPGK